MSREPAYPKDAAVSPAPAPQGAGQSGGAHAVADKDGARGDPRRRKQLVTGAAIGIGSAAIVAALLYANRSRRSDRS